MTTKIIFATDKAAANQTANDWHALGYKIVGIGPSSSSTLLGISGQVFWSSPDSTTGYLVIATTEGIAGPY